MEDLFFVSDNDLIRHICLWASERPESIVSRPTLFGSTALVSNKAVIKFFDPEIRSLEHLRFTSSVAHQLSLNGLVLTPKTIKVDGVEMICSTGSSHAIATMFVTGDQPYQDRRAAELKISDNHLDAMASLMANFHRGANKANEPASSVPLQLFPSYGFLTHPFEEFVSAYTALSEVPGFLAYASRIKRSIEQNARIITQSISVDQLIPIHNDIIPRNLVFGDRDCVVGVFDFDLCNLGLPLFDLAWTLDYFGYPRLMLDTPECPRYYVMNRFLRTYNSCAVHPFTDAVISAAIPLARVGFSLSCANIAAKRGNNVIAENELRWLADFLAFYFNHPFTPKL